MRTSTGIVLDAILLSIARAISRKGQRESRQISDTEAYGHAMVMQGRYNFVPDAESALFCEEITRTFRYVEQRQLTGVSSVAYAKFRLDELIGNSILDEALVKDLQSLGYEA